jgi:DNA-binding transcriptional regulator YiaG
MNDIQWVRKTYKLTQVELALILGVDPQTVSKWERDVLTPSNHMWSLMAHFHEGRLDAAKVLREKGTIKALIYLLEKD